MNRARLGRGRLGRGRLGRGRIVLAVVAVLAVLTACSGVPTSSVPQVVKSIGVDETPGPTVPGPAPGSDPRRIVADFLNANYIDPDRHNAARAYLTAGEAQKWQDTTVTIVSAAPRIDPALPDNSVKVNFQRVGVLSADGIYTPQLSGIAPTEQSTFQLLQEKGEWRIDQLPPGLLITADEFRAAYTARPLYFLNSGGTRLVPDLRWSALSSQQPLATFLLTQLLAGPRPELANAVNTDVPAQAAQQRASVTVGTPTVVQVPGARNLDAGYRQRLAAQLAYTLKISGFASLSSLALQDGNDPVDVGVSTPFDAASLGQFAPVADTVQSVTFVRDGAVYDDTGKPLAGALGTPRYQLTAAAFLRHGDRTQVVGTTGPVGAASMLIGSDQTLGPVAGLPLGPMTRPVWAPGTSSEAWVGSGSTLYKVIPGQAAVAVTQTPSRSGPTTGVITSLAFSPEGTRLALVIVDPDGASQVWMGAVFRNGPDVRLDELEPITSPALRLTDVGWRDDTTLLAVGSATGAPAGQAGFWLVRADGAQLSAGDDISGLPDGPRTLAVSPNSQTVWVTLGDGAASTVWQRTGSTGSWAAPSGTASEAGSAPAFSV